MKLSDLAGKHILSGIETGKIKRKDNWGDDYDAQYIKFTLDGVSYMAVENPDDGYRSYCEDLIVSDVPCKTWLPNVEVVGYMVEHEWKEKDVILFIDTHTGKRVLSIGTDYGDEYYPTCILEWIPENLVCNAGK